MHRQLSPSSPSQQPPQRSSPSPQSQTSQPEPQPQPPNPTPSPGAAVTIPPSFTRRKEAILDQLSVPDEDYTDLSPKGTVDAGIRDLIDEINSLDGLVTTSSCGGRVSVFLEGRRGGKGGKVSGEGGEVLPGHHLAVVDDDGDDGDGGDDDEDDDDEGAQGGGEGDEGEGEGVMREPALVPPRSRSWPDGGGAGGGTGTETVAGVGGKGGGGRWLFVSHDPVETHGKLDCEPNIVAALLGMEEPIFDGREGISADEMSGGESRLIHFKFEPMILHVLTASLHHAQLILRCGLQAGFRESGAINLLPPSTSSGGGAAVTPIVAIRSMGLGLESLIGREVNRIKHCTVSREYLKALIKIANERFVENARRIERFRVLLREATSTGGSGGGGKAKVRKGDGGGEWESAEVRRERKRLEGLRRAEEVRRLKKESQRVQDEEEEAQDTPVMPAVEGPAVVLGQAPHDVAAGPLEGLGHLAHVGAGLEPLAQRRDLLGHGVPGGGRLLRGRGRRDLVRHLLEAGVLLLLQLLELRGHARLHLQLRELLSGVDVHWQS
ncbi:hypothetical protein VMCG_01648 [Cytospora schulzeri]|uniref:tRNA(Phe) 7-[(3-amino-3-carboxypropyl)-4-demethylwyosine(37)-N(4)]-methyltransferase n=1 Tax=Cytospora schulzeri TaxID=448051 RepID=A0A423X458_9PEZI|nr:hypothetical protein VMCG_01648 [Valsa malicola]